MFNSNLYVRFLKQQMYVFQFMFNILYLMFEILIYDGWSHFVASPYSSLLMIEVEKAVKKNSGN